VAGAARRVWLVRPLYFTISHVGAREGGEVEQRWSTAGSANGMRVWGFWGWTWTLFVGHVYARWVDTTRPHRMRLPHTSCTTGETDRRWHHRSHHERLTIVSN
jgi:hypothetical protein